MTTPEEYKMLQLVIDQLTCRISKLEDQVAYLRNASDVHTETINEHADILEKLEDAID